MWRAVQLALLAILGCLAAGGATTPIAVPREQTGTASRIERPVPFRAGETLSYDVAWTSFVTAGTVTLSVREKRPSFGSVAYYITGEARPSSLVAALYSLYYKADTLIDVYTLLPQRGSIYSEEGGRRRMKITRFTQSARSAQFEVQTATKVARDLSVPAFTQDALSTLYILRALPLKPGAKVTMPVCDGGSTYRVAISVGGRESVRTGLGPLQGLRVTPTISDAQGMPAGRGLVLWLSDDARRLPLRLQADLSVGSIYVTLRDVR